MRMKRESQTELNQTVLMKAVEESNDLFVVRGVGDLLSMGGTWVAMIVVGQIAMAWHVAQWVERCFAVSAVHVIGSLGLGYFLLDVAVYRILRGRLIFQWTVPALCLIAATMTPCLLVHLWGVE